jgi:hypothetical protein
MATGEVMERLSPHSLSYIMATKQVKGRKEEPPRA